MSLVKFTFWQDHHGYHDADITSHKKHALLSRLANRIWKKLAFLGKLRFLGRGYPVHLSSLRLYAPLSGLLLVMDASGDNLAVADVEAVRQLVLDAERASVWVIMVVVIPGDQLHSSEVYANEVLQ